MNFDDTLYKKNKVCKIDKEKMKEKPVANMIAITFTSSIIADNAIFCLPQI